MWAMTFSDYMFLALSVLYWCLMLKMCRAALASSEFISCMSTSLDPCFCFKSSIHNFQFAIVIISPLYSLSTFAMLPVFST